MLSRLILILICLFSGLKLKAAEIYTGRLEKIYVDSKRHPEIIYRLALANGEKKKLLVGKHFHYGVGDRLEISGNETNQGFKVSNVIRISKKFALSNSSQSETTGSKKLLVVMITDSSYSDDGIPYSQAQIEQIFSTGSTSLKDYMTKASDSKFNLTVDVLDTLAVSNLCQSDSLFAHGAEDDALAVVDNAIGNLASYDFVTFIVPDSDACLADAAGIGTVGKMSYFANAGLLELGVNFTRSYNAASYDNAMLSTGIHEFGHNLGLQHDNSNSCGTAIFSATACPGIEYGGSHSIMGLAPNIAHFNTIQKQDLGWLSSSEILTIDSNSLTKDIELLPVSSTASGYKAIRIRRNDGRYYFIEYRQPIGYDAIADQDFMSSFLNFSGFLVYLDEQTIGNRPILMDSNFEDYRSSSQLVDLGSEAYYTNFDVAYQMHDKAPFTINDTFHDTVSDIEVTASSLNSSSALITVNKGSVADDSGSSDDSGSDDDSTNNGSGNDSSGDDPTSFDTMLIDAKTLSEDFAVKFKKKKKAFLLITPNQFATSDRVFTVINSSTNKKLFKVKNNAFTAFDGASIKVIIASEKKLQKHGYTVDADGYYNFTIYIREKAVSSDFATIPVTLKVKSSLL